MFGIGLPEMIVILIVALLVVGPDKLPELARSLAKGVNELRAAMNQVKESLHEETKVISSAQDELRQTAVQMRDKLLAEELGGGPQRLPAAEAELEADLDSLALRPWERDAAAGRTEVEAVGSSAGAPQDEAEDIAEERVIGKNPPPPDPAPAA